MSEKPASPFAVFIVGTGRSGTSLLTQSLEALGLELPEDAVPANENNLRGTGESIAVRDRMVGLSTALGIGTQFRPADWRDAPKTRTTAEWIATYMAQRRDAAKGAGFVIKFPRASIFLPIWIEAAAQIGLELRFVWATRRAEDTLRSLMQADATTLQAAALVYAQRCFYILRDAPPETLMLPYEGWSEDPDAQIAALCTLTGVTDPDRIAAARSSFTPLLNRSGAGEPLKVPEPITRFDKRIGGKRGPIRKILSVGKPIFQRDQVSLSLLIDRLQPNARQGLAADALDARLTLLKTLAETSDTETPEMKKELEVLTQRIRDVNARNLELERAAQAPAKGGKARPDAAPAPADDAGLKKARKKIKKLKSRLRDRQAQLGIATQELHSATEERDALYREITDLRTKAVAIELELEKVRAAYARLTRDFDAQEEDINARTYDALRAVELNEARYRTQAERLQKSLEQARARIEKLEEKA